VQEHTLKLALVEVLMDRHYLRSIATTDGSRLANERSVLTITARPT